MKETNTENRPEPVNHPRRILCLLGLHKFVLVESVGAFGAAGSVEKVRCKRCGVTAIRPQK